MTSRSQYLKRILMAFCGFLIFVGVSACSSNSGISEADAEKALLQIIQGRRGGGTIRLKSFKKVDGVIREEFDRKEYLLEYEAEVECLEGRCAYSRNCDGFGQWFPSQTGGASVAKGTVTKLKGGLTYRKSEKGWRLVGEVSKSC